MGEALSAQIAQVGDVSPSVLPPWELHACIMPALRDVLALGLSAGQHFYAQTCRSARSCRCCSRPGSSTHASCVLCAIACVSSVGVGDTSPCRSHRWSARSCHDCSHPGSSAFTSRPLSAIRLVWVLVFMSFNVMELVMHVCCEAAYNREKGGDVCRRRQGGGEWPGAAGKGVGHRWWDVRNP
jgi:hypothetical protein